MRVVVAMWVLLLSLLPICCLLSLLLLLAVIQTKQSRGRLFLLLQSGSFIVVMLQDACAGDDCELSDWATIRVEASGGMGWLEVMVWVPCSVLVDGCT